MLKRGAVLIALLVGVVVVVQLATRRSEAIESAPSHVSENASVSASVPATESATVVASPVVATPREGEDEVPLTVRLAAIRDDVHVLEMQRVDARARHDAATEARLDAEIATLRAENDRLRGATHPEGI